MLEDERGRVRACVSVDFPEAGTAELHRLCLLQPAPPGPSALLVRHVEEHARRQGAGRLFFWSDTRFTGAHRLYERMGYVRGGATRELGDISGSVEFRFEKRL